MCTVNSPVSSSGTNVRPTMRLSGTVIANTTMEMPMMAIGCASVQRRDVLYTWSTLRKNPLSFVFASLSASDSFMKRELSIGVNVKLTTIEIKIENAIVHPNG